MRTNTDKRRPQRLGRVLQLALAMALLTMTVGGTAVLVDDEPASAVSCWGDWCSGRDPSSTGCDRDATTVAHRTWAGTGLRLEMRYSRTCKTQWARLNWPYHARTAGELKIVQSTGYTQRGVINYNSYWAWSPMIYTPTHLAYAAWIGPPGSKATAWW